MDEYILPNVIVAVMSPFSSSWSLMIVSVIPFSLQRSMQGYILACMQLHIVE